MLTVNHLIQRLESDIDTAHANIASFAEVVKTNPYRASETHTVIRSAGVLLIADSCLKDMQNGCTIEDQLEFLKRLIRQHIDQANRLTDVQGESLYYLGRLVDLLEKY